MKKSLFLLFAAVVAMAVSSCDPQPGPGPKDEGNFTFAADSVTASSAIITVTSKDTTKWFYFDIAESAEVAECGGVAAYADSLYEYLADYYLENSAEWAEYGISSFSDYLAFNVSVGSDYYEYYGLWGDTQYTIVAFYIDSLSLEISGVEGAEFKTGRIVPSSNTFQIDVVGGTITVTPSNQDPYFFDFVGKDELEEYGYTSIEEYAEDDIEYYDYFGMLSECISIGKTNYDFSTYMDEGKEYIAFAFGFDGGFTTEITTEEFVYTPVGAPGRRVPGRRAPSFVPGIQMQKVTSHKSIR